MRRIILFCAVICSPVFFLMLESMNYGMRLFLHVRFLVPAGLRGERGRQAHRGLAAPRRALQEGRPHAVLPLLGVGSRDLRSNAPSAVPPAEHVLSTMARRCGACSSLFSRMPFAASFLTFSITSIRGAGVDKGRPGGSRGFRRVMAESTVLPAGTSTPKVEGAWDLGGVSLTLA